MENNSDDSPVNGAWIAPSHMNTYVAAASGDRSRALTIARWDRQLALALFADLAVLEPALRNSMNEQLTRRWGTRWYASQEVHLDDRTSRQLSEAWARTAARKHPDDVIARCMFGFWRGLLDRGDHVGRQPRRVRCRYDELWRGVLDRAFPGGRAQALRDGQRWQRGYALAVVSRVNELRNRVAHHEPLFTGVPAAGQLIRRSVQSSHGDCLRLAAMLDRDLHTFLLSTSTVPALLSSPPCALGGR